MLACLHAPYTYTWIHACIHIHTYINAYWHPYTCSIYFYSIIFHANHVHTHMPMSACISFHYVCHYIWAHDLYIIPEYAVVNLHILCTIYVMALTPSMTPTYTYVHNTTLALSLEQCTDLFRIATQANGCVQFSGHWYVQQQDLPQGAHFSPDMTNMYLCVWEYRFLDNIVPSMYPLVQPAAIYRGSNMVHRYIDDLRLYGAPLITDAIMDGHVYPASLQPVLVCDTRMSPAPHVSQFLNMETKVSQGSIVRGMYQKTDKLHAAIMPMLYFSFHDCRPYVHKTAIIKSLVVQILTICSSHAEVHIAVQHLARQLCQPAPFPSTILQVTYSGCNPWVLFSIFWYWCISCYSISKKN